MNRKGRKPEKLIPEEIDLTKTGDDIFHNTVGQDDLDRFNRPKKKSRKKKRRNFSKKQHRKPRK